MSNMSMPYYDNAGTMNTSFGVNYDMSVITSIVVRKLVLRESGTYNNQFSRSYEAHLNAQSVNRLSEQVADKGLSVIKPSLLSGTASNMFSISATPESNDPIGIQNGWNSQRLLFFMDVMTTGIGGENTIYYIQGYTDYVGLSLQNKHLDPEMVFYINNIMVVKPLRAYNTPGGMVANQSLVSTDHLLYNLQGQNGHNRWAARPEDVYNILTGTSFSQRVADNNNGTFPNIHDKRAMLGSGPKMSRRTNAVPTNYTSDLLNSFIKASNTLSQETNPIDVYENAVDIVSESLPSYNPFLTALSKHSSSGMVSGAFRWRDLLSIDTSLALPNNERLTVAVSGATQMRRQHQTGMTAHWNSGNIETKYAATISQAIPALMLECMLYQIAFSSTNLVRVEGTLTGIYTLMTNGTAMHGGQAIREIEMFKHRLETEVLRDISYNNHQKFDIKVEASVFADTWISISIDGGPSYDFVTPTFCDGIISPVLSQNHDKVNELANSVGVLVSQVADASQTGQDRHTFSMPQYNQNESYL